DQQHRVSPQPERFDEVYSGRPPMGTSSQQEGALRGELSTRSHPSIPVATRIAQHPGESIAIQFEGGQCQRLAQCLIARASLVQTMKLPETEPHTYCGLHQHE